MKIKNIPFSVSISITLLTCNMAANAGNMQVNNDNLPNNTNPGQNWLPQQPTDHFWQAPNWSNFQKPVQPQLAAQAPALQVPSMNEKAFLTDSTTTGKNAKSDATGATNSSTSQPQKNSSRNAIPPMNVPPRMPGHMNNFRPPMPQGYNIPPYQRNPYQRPFATQMYPPMPYGRRPYPPANMYQGYRQPQNMNQPAKPMQQKQGNQATQPPVPDYRPPAYYPPNYNRYNNRYNNNNWGNKFWGRSGPRTWTNPNKNNMERGWDDMINAPSRMGRMPGGWSAPEITMPNPVDLGDQFQENVQDLPEQLRNMDVGN